VAPAAGPREGVTVPRWRTLLTDPLGPVLLLTGAAVLAVAALPALTWAVVGGLAGFTLSGSV
jgi:hypothetical protein